MLALKFVEGVRHIPNEAPLQELETLSLTNRRVRGDQDHRLSLGIPHGVRLRTSNTHRANTAKPICSPNMLTSHLTNKTN